MGNDKEKVIVVFIAASVNGEDVEEGEEENIEVEDDDDDDLLWLLLGKKYKLRVCNFITYRGSIKIRTESNIRLWIC